MKRASVLLLVTLSMLMTMSTLAWADPGESQGIRP